MRKQNNKMFKSLLFRLPWKTTQFHEEFHPRPVVPFFTSDSKVKQFQCNNTGSSWIRSHLMMLIYLKQKLLSL